jgi:hypothetical protein
LVVYHGSANNFTVFNKSKIGLNFIESENGGFFFTQKKQSEENYAFLATNGINKGFIYQCFLNIKNPINRNTNSEYYCPADRYDISRDEYIREIFLNKKLNGVIIIGTRKDNLYVVVKPNQIKLADGTNTTFDSNNPDIRYADGGTIPDLLSSQEVADKLGRELHWWNDDIVYLSGIEYKKVYLRPEYKKL